VDWQNKVVDYNQVVLRIISSNDTCRLRTNLPSVEIELLALQAGMDVLALTNQLQFDPDIAAKTIAIVKQLLHEGKLTPARIDES